MKKLFKATARNWKYALAGATLLAQLIASVVHPAPPAAPSRYHVQGSYHPKEGVKFDLEKR